MATIDQGQVDHSLIPLPRALEDTMHGQMTGFEMVTACGAHDIIVHPLAACPTRSYLEVHGFESENNIETPLVLEDSKGIAPQTPDHGVVFDWARLNTLRV